MPAVLTITILGVTVGQVLFTVGMMALSYVLSSVLQPDGLKGTSQTDPGVRAQVPPDTTTPLPVVYGDAFLGGRFVDAVLTSEQARMYYVHAISCISENGQFSFDTSKFYYGDRLITFDTTDPWRVVSLTDGAGNVDTKIFQDGQHRLQIFLYTSDKNGNITPQNSPYLPWEWFVMGNTNIPEELRWDPTGTIRNMNGLAFAIILLEYNRDAGTTQLQPITYHCSHYLNGTGVAKPGDVWYDYMTNPIYGAAVEPEFVDSDAATALNIYSDELITFNDYEGNPQTQPRYRINGVVDTGKAVLKNIDDIMQACDSWASYSAENGKWSVVINKAQNAQLALSDNNIIGGINVGTTELTQAPNIIEAKFPDKTNRDQYNYATESVPTALLYPNEPVNKQTTTYELVNDSVQALYLANRILEQGREDLTVTINTNYVGIQLSAGDVVSVTNSAYGWNEKLFRCMQVREAVTQDGSLGAQLQLAEYNAQVYDNFDITQFNPAGNTELPSLGYFSTLTAPTITDSQPYAILPSFDVNCFTPATGLVTSISLFYSTTATPTAGDWHLYTSVALSNSATYPQSATVTFANIYLTEGTYYFGYKVSNSYYSSPISAMSLPFVWAPDPTSIRTFQTNFAPSVLLVPYNGTTADFTGITFQLYGNNGLGPVDFSMAQDDSDASFVNNSWRIGASSTGGFGDIVKTNITVGNPTDGGTFAQFPVPTAMSSDVATVFVPVRYKDGSGDISQTTPASIQFAYAAQGEPGKQSASPMVYQWAITIPSGPVGTSTYTWATDDFTPTPSGWYTSPPAAPGSGYTLWGASVQLIALATDVTSTINWTLAGITARGNSGTAGSSARICYTKTTLSSLNSTPSTITTSGSSSFPPNDSWGTGTVWQATPQTIVAGESVWQSDGIYSPSSGNTVWNVPYLSTLKVGSLSAISANLGTITAGSITGVTITGGTIQTATSGKRVVMSGSTNDVSVYDSSGNQIAKLGGTSGTLYCDSTSAPPVFPVISAYQSQSGGNYPSIDIPAIFGTNIGNGVWGQSTSNGVGVFGRATTTGGTNHGIRGANAALSGGVQTSGLVGSSVGYDFYADGAGTNYGPFTGAHDVLVAVGKNIPIGYIVADVKCIVKKNLSNTVFEVQETTQANQIPIGVMVTNNGLLANIMPAAFVEGIDYSDPENPSYITYPEYDENKDFYDYCAANAVGEGQVYVCGESGDITAGDLIVTSSTAGVGMKQADGVVRNYTVAKARESVTFTDTTTPVLVACIYLCG